MSAFYACYFAALGAFLPYWPLYLEAAGYDPVRIGWIMAVLPATKIFSPSLWGWLADRSGRTLSLIRWASFFACIGFAGEGFLPTETAWQLAILALFSFCWNPALPLFETVTLGHLVRQPARYSQVRLWGSVGFILSVLGLGESLEGTLTLDRLPKVILLLLILQWLVSLTVPNPPRSPAPPRASPSMGEILRCPSIYSFLVAAFLLQLSHGPYYAFYSVHLNGVGYSDQAIGLLWALGVVAEIVIFRYMHRLTSRFTLRSLFLGSLLFGVLRWLLIAWGVESLFCLIVAQLLHAATFGLSHVSAIAIIHHHFRGAHHGKGQALYAGLSFGLGGALGTLYSGEFWAFWGPGWVFTSAAGFSALAWLIAWPAVARRMESLAATEG